MCNCLQLWKSVVYLLPSNQNNTMSNTTTTRHNEIMNAISVSRSMQKSLQAEPEFKNSYYYLGENTYSPEIKLKMALFLLETKYAYAVNRGTQFIEQVFMAFSYEQLVK